MKHPDLARLVRVDALDQRILRLRRDIEDLPNDLARPQARVANLKKDLDAARLLVKETQKEVDRCELDTRSNLDQIGKYRMQQNQAKSNDEYAALKRQIEALEAKNGDLEDEALMGLERLDELKAKAKSAEQELKEAEADLAREKQGVDADVAKLAAERETLEAERAQALGEVTPEVRSVYERIHQKWNGRALALLQGAKCEACRIDVPTGLAGSVHVGRDIVTCPSCSRILYVT